MPPNLSFNPDVPRRAYGPSVVAPVSLFPYRSASTLMRFALT
jgi:hypothetical protein